MAWCDEILSVRCNFPRKEKSTLDEKESEEYSSDVKLAKIRRNE